MKIDNSTKSVVTGAIAGSESRALMPDAPDAPASSKVKLSSLAANLNKAEQALADTPVVNTGRVAELTQAIRENRFTVDAGKVAHKLVETAAELIRAHKA